MPKQSHPDFLIKLILRARALETETDGRDRGYIMLVTSVLSIMLFSMLAAYLVLTDMSKTATSAFVDSTNTFMAAETGLNTRANLVRDKFANYNRPSGRAPKYIDGVNLLSLTNRPTNAQVIEAMKSCIYAVPGTDTATTYRRGTDDLACAGNSGWTNNADGSRSYNESSISTSDAKYNSSSRWQDIQSGDGDSRTNLSKYTAYSFVVDKTNYTGTNNAPPIETLSSGDYAGLKAQTYTYSVYASAIDNQAAVDTTNINTVLQMDFRSRVIPLFQFAAFYEGDLEAMSSSNMTLGGWVHTNGNFYSQPHTTNTGISTTLTSKLTAAGEIYNRIDSETFSVGGITRMLKTGTTSTYLPFPARIDPARPLNTTEITALENAKDGAAGAQSLYSPPAGFLRKRSYYNSRTGATASQSAMAVGDYWANADMRLELVPDRGGINTTPNEAIIPFSFTAIQQGGTNPTTCSTTAPAAETDPVANYISPDRAGAANMQCTLFTKGQLQSLRQPVMVLTAINQPDTSIDHTDPTVTGAESKTLGRPATLPTPPTLSTTANTNATKLKILRALQVAMASTPSPIAYDRLGTALNNSVYNLGDHLQTFRIEFRRLLDTIPTAELPTADVNNLMTFSPNQIAALRNAWFLPAPIQRVSTNNNPTTAGNPSNSGFYDGRERRWMTMLQTNIKSLSVWNRDGLYVNADNETMTAAYSTDNTRKGAAFNSGTGANFTDSLAFTRAAAVSTAPLGSMRRLGLGSTDITEGGLVFHATVNDDLNGDGTISATADVTPDTTKSVYKRKPDNTIALDRNRAQIVADYARKYKGAINTTSDTNKAQAADGYYGESPYGFAFNDGDYLPGALTLVTDQSIYIQGNFNNHNNARTDNTTPTILNDTTYTPSPQRLPAAVMGDTITILSNQCVSSNSAQSKINNLGVPAGQLNCGLPSASKGSVNIISSSLGAGASNTAYYTGNNSNVWVSTNDNSSAFYASGAATYYNITAPVAVNAAFLSYTGISYGNAGTNRGYGAAAGDLRHSGAINNYMRMLEDWGGPSGRYLHYYGSFVSLGIPLENSGKYRLGPSYNTTTATSGGYFYGIPQRNFNFDTNFDSVDGLPPMTPRGIYLEQQVFRRSRNY